MNKLLSKALATSSKASYDRAWAKFHEFMTKTLRRKSLPAKQKDVALYVTHLYENGLKATSIRTHLSAIAYVHKLNEKTNPTDSFLISKILLGIQQSSPKCYIRVPIQLPLLHRLLRAIQSLGLCHYETTLLKALFSTMYHAALRISEVCHSRNTNHVLQHHHISIAKGGSHCLIRFSSHKHGKGTPTPLKLKWSRPSSTCPVSLLNTYIANRGKWRGPLFAHQSRLPISRPYVVETLKSTLTALHQDHTKFNTHSFRIGKASDLAEGGASNTQIALVGRWRSTAYKAYTRPKHIDSNPLRLPSK